MHGVTMKIEHSEDVHSVKINISPSHALINHKTVFKTIYYNYITQSEVLSFFTYIQIR